MEYEWLNNDYPPVNAYQKKWKRHERRLFSEWETMGCPHLCQFTLE